MMAEISTGSTITHGNVQNCGPRPCSQGRWPGRV